MAAAAPPRAAPRCAAHVDLSSNRAPVSLLSMCARMAATSAPSVPASAPADPVLPSIPSVPTAATTAGSASPPPPDAISATIRATSSWQRPPLPFLPPARRTLTVASPPNTTHDPSPPDLCHAAAIRAAASPTSPDTDIVLAALYPIPAALDSIAARHLALPASTAFGTTGPSGVSGMRPAAPARSLSITGRGIRRPRPRPWTAPRASANVVGSPYVAPEDTTAGSSPATSDMSSAAASHEAASARRPPFMRDRCFLTQLTSEIGAPAEPSRSIARALSGRSTPSGMHSRDDPPPDTRNSRSSDPLLCETYLSTARAASTLDLSGSGCAARSTLKPLPSGAAGAPVGATTTPPSTFGPNASRAAAAMPKAALPNATILTAAYGESSTGPLGDPADHSASISPAVLPAPRTASRGDAASRPASISLRARLRALPIASSR